MTETDKIYTALTETLKKYGPEHTVKGLEEYITNGNTAYFTRENKARELISELAPYEIMAEIFRTTLKYEIIETEKGVAKEMPDEQKVLNALYDYQTGNKITSELRVSELDDLMRRSIKGSVYHAVGMLAQNPEVFRNYLALYINLVCNNRKDLNNIPNEQFRSIDEYFSQYQEKVDQPEKQM